MAANDVKNAELPLFQKEERKDEEKNTSPCCLKFKAVSGILLALATGVLFATATTLVTTAEVQGIPAFQILSIAYTSLLLFALFMCLVNRQNIFTIGGKNIAILFSMGFFRWLAITFQYYAFKFLPVGDATAVLRGIAPVLTALAALIFLHEPWSWAEIFITVVNIVGVVLVAGPVFIFGEEEGSYLVDDADDIVRYEGIGFALSVGCAISFSCSYVLARSLQDNFSVSCRLIYDSTIGTILSFVFLYVSQKGDVAWSMSSEIAIFLVVYCLIENIALYAFYKSFKLEAAATVSMLLNIEVFTSYIYQASVFDMEPTPLEIIGAVIIVFSSAVVFAIKWKRHSQENERETLLLQCKHNHNDTRFGSLETTGESH